MNVNSPEITSKVVSLLREGIGKHFSFVIVDNGSSQENFRVAQMKIAHPNSEVLRLERRVSIGAAFNTGISRVIGDCDSVLLIHNDVFVDSADVFGMSERLASSPRVGMVSPLVMYLNEPNRIWFAGSKRNFWRGDNTPNPGTGQQDNGQLTDAYPVQCLSLACMMVKSEVFQRVGLLDTNLSGNEEDDLSLRSLTAGFINLVDPRFRAYHLVGNTSRARGSVNEELLVSSAKAYFYFVRKHASNAQLVSSIMWRTLTFPRVLRQFYSSSSLATVRGILQGGSSFLTSVLRR